MYVYASHWSSLIISLWPPRFCRMRHLDRWRGESNTLCWVTWVLSTMVSAYIYLSYQFRLSNIFLLNFCSSNLAKSRRCQVFQQLYHTRSSCVAIVHSNSPPTRWQKSPKRSLCPLSRISHHLYVAIALVSTHSCTLLLSSSKVAYLWHSEFESLLCVKVVAVASPSFSPCYPTFSPHFNYRLLLCLTTQEFPHQQSCSLQSSAG